MKMLTCAVTRRRLQAFYDGELSVEEQIAVHAHLDWCDTCAAALCDLEVVGSNMRAVVRSRTVLSQDEASVFQAAVVNRLKAERDASFWAGARVMFEDMHMVYAGVGATAATIACGVAVLFMMRFAPIGKPDPLASLAKILSITDTSQMLVPLSERVRMPRALGGTFSTPSNPAGDDGVFMLAAVVTREGRVANLELLPDSAGTRAQPGTSDAKQVAGMLDAISRTRFQPAQVEGLPVAVNIVWMVAHTTVRASKSALGQHLPRPIRKRSA